MMTQEEEDKLQNQKVTDLLNKITDLKEQAMEDKSHFYVANTLGRCHEIIQDLHVINVHTIRENRHLLDTRRLHLAGLAMQALLTRLPATEYYPQQIPKAAFDIADKMVNYGKQDSKTKCTDDGTGITSTKNSNDV